MMRDADPGTPPVDLQAVRLAADVIRPYVRRTPVFTSEELDRELGCGVHFKCENLQRVGAFKARGALNAVLSLPDQEAARGVVTHSSGNHGAALAYAASVRGIPSTVVMPDTTPAIKVDNVRAYGAEIVFCKREERERTTERLVQERGLSLIHPYADPRVIAGQGTAALELLEDVPELDTVVAPVGGGGLLAGTATAVGAMRPAAEVFGAEPEAADDAYRSLRAGALQPPVREPRTSCDGLLTGLGELNFDILRRRGVEVLLVAEDRILEATFAILRLTRLVVEPSAGTVLAAIRTHRRRFRGKRVGAILSGGNTDFAWLRTRVPGA
jgi:threonine dehydratase